jgi:hypothetical protein
MLDTAGIPEGELLVRAVRQFPELTPAELWAALQDATAAAERKVVAQH